MAFRITGKLSTDTAQSATTTVRLGRAGGTERGVQKPLSLLDVQTRRRRTTHITDLLAGYSRVRAGARRPIEWTFRGELTPRSPTVLAFHGSVAHPENVVRNYLTLAKPLDMRQIDALQYFWQEGQQVRLDEDVGVWTTNAGRRARPPNIPTPAQDLWTVTTRTHGLCVIADFDSRASDFWVGMPQRIRFTMVLRQLTAAEITA